MGMLRLGSMATAHGELYLWCNLLHKKKNLPGKNNPVWQNSVKRRQHHRLAGGLCLNKVIFKQYTFASPGTYRLFLNQDWDFGPPITHSQTRHHLWPYLWTCHTVSINMASVAMNVISGAQNNNAVVFEHPAHPAVICNTDNNPPPPILIVSITYKSLETGTKIENYYWDLHLRRKHRRNVTDTNKFMTLRSLNEMQK